MLWHNMWKDDYIAASGENASGDGDLWSEVRYKLKVG